MCLSSREGKLVQHIKSVTDEICYTSFGVACKQYNILTHRQGPGQHELCQIIYTEVSRISIWTLSSIHAKANSTGPLFYDCVGMMVLAFVEMASWLLHKLVTVLVWV